MKNISILLLALFLLSSAHAQKTNDKLKSQNRNAKIEITFDGGTTKLIAVAENFSDSEAKAAKIMAINFAIGFYYPGQTLERMPHEMLLTFWVMSKKPIFAERNSLTFYVDGEELNVSDIRYSARARESMEYLNFKVNRDLLVKIASTSNVYFKLGDSTFKFTSNHMRMLADLLELSDPMIN